MSHLQNFRYYAAVVILLLAASAAKAQKNYVTIFTADRGIARPITIKSSNGTFKLYDEVRTGHVSWFEAYDANGNKIMQPSPKRSYRSNSSGSSGSSHYHFTTLYPQSNGSSYSGSSSYSSRGSGSYSSSRNSQTSIPSYEGNYYNPPYYTNETEYILWKLPKPAPAKGIDNPQQYCGKWGDKTALERLAPNMWTVEISLNGDDFNFTFKLKDFFEFYKRENENNWLFYHKSHEDKSSTYYNDCGSDADPGYPRSGTYNYDETYMTSLYRLTLEDGRPKMRAVLGHANYYYKGVHTYCESFTFVGVSSPMVKYILYDDSAENIGSHDWVDLGLSVKWATKNVGAEKTTDGGYYYAWGETQSKKKYDWSNYVFWEDGSSVYDVQLSKYNETDGKIVLEQEDDAASVAWGDGWRIPTRDEVIELIEKCDWETAYLNGVKVYMVTGPNGNSIFFTLNGYINSDGNLQNKGINGCYWSSTRNKNVPGGAVDFNLDNEAVKANYNYRIYGNSIRPVIDVDSNYRTSQEMRIAADSLKYEKIKELDLARDFKKAAEAASELYENSTTSWKAYGAFALGVYYQYGLGVEIDLDRAYSYLIEAFNLGYKVASVSLGMLIIYNDDHFNEDASKWFSIAVKEGLSGGYLGLAIMECDNSDTADRAVENLKRAADMGNYFAEALYGRYVLLFGHPEEAKEYFKKALNAGVQQSFYNNITTMIMLCDFCISHPQYSIFYSFRDGECYVPRITEEDNDVIVGVVKEGKMGFLKLSYKGEVLASTPIKYLTDDFPCYDSETKLFQVYIPTGPINQDGYQPRRSAWIDINGKEVSK